MQSPIQSHVLLDRHDHVREHRRAAGAGDREQVREPGRVEPEVGAGPGAPTRRAAAGRRRPRMSMRMSAPVIASKPVA